MVGQAVQQRAGETLRAEDRGPLVEGQVGGDQDGTPLVALAEHLEEEFCPGGGQGDEAQRSFSSPWVEPEGQVQVTVRASNFGALGAGAGVIEREQQLLEEIARQ